MYAFTDDFLIGNEAIDNDHRYLFELLNKANEILMNEYAMDRYTEIKKILVELESYADEHFAREEAYMISIRDPEIIIQRHQHLTFDEKVQEFMVQNVDEDEQQQKILEEITEFIARWLICHIIGSDILIGKLPPLEEWMMKENPCEFSPEYEIGIEFIDAEHKELFRIIGNADYLAKHENLTEHLDDILNLITELKQYTKEHFADEEEYMESIHYKGLAAQKRAHEAFIYEIDSIDLKKLLDDPKKNMESILEFLLGWLINHIVNQDLKIPVKREE